MIRTVDIAIVDTGMPPIALHLKNLPPEKWPHGEQARWWTHAERFYILEQPAEFRRYIRARDRVIATLASQAAISATSRRGSCREDSLNLKEAKGRLPAGQQKPQQKATLNVVSQQLAVRPQHKLGCPCQKCAQGCTQWIDARYSRRCPWGSAL